MRFEPYHRLAGRPNLIVDGSPTEGTTRCVTHWPGFPPPAELAADLSAQMAFRLLDHPELVPAGTELVSNNHFDQDGLVSILALVDPARVRPRQRVLEAVAEAGDFATTTDRDAARVSMALSACAAGAEPSLGPLPERYDELTGLLYAELLPRLPEWCDRPDVVRHLWGDEDATLSASERAFESGDVTIEELPELDLAIVRVAGAAPATGGHRFGGEWAAGLHPMAVFNRTERSVVVTVRGRDYRVELRYEGWVQYRSRVVRPRRDLVPLAERLSAEEAGDATWQADAVGALTPTLVVAGDTTIAADRFLALLVGHLAGAPPAWDPFRADG